MARGSMLEVLLFASVAINAALLIFIAGVLKRTTDDMDDAVFKNFIASLVRHSKRSVFTITALNIPAVFAILYLYYFGIGHWWTTVGLALWLAAGLVSKMIKLPIYNLIALVESTNSSILRECRRKLNAANMFQALLYSAATLIMAAAFYPSSIH